MNKFIISFVASMILFPASAYAESASEDVKVEVVDGAVKLVAAQMSWEAYCLGSGRSICLSNCQSTHQQMTFFCQSQPGDIYGEQLMQCLDYTESEYQSCQDQCNQPCAGEA